VIVLATDAVTNAALVHITGAAIYIVVASQAGNTKYVAAPDKKHTITINQATSTTTAALKPLCRGED
jgi:hypothetical protein